MITLQDGLKQVDYTVTETWQYCWDCFGEKAIGFDATNEYADVTFMYNAELDELVQVTVNMSYNHPEYNKGKMFAYRWTHPDFVKAVYEESVKRGIDDGIAWDDVRWADTDSEEDILQKVSDMWNGVPHDTRVIMNIDIDDETFLIVAKRAHERDITFNEMITEMLLWVKDNEEDFEQILKKHGKTPDLDEDDEDDEYLDDIKRLEELDDSDEDLEELDDDDEDHWDCDDWDECK